MFSVLRIIILSVFHCCLVYYCQAQETKEIKIQWDTNHDWQKHSLLRPKTDSTVFEMMVAALKNGEVPCYAYTDDAIITPLPLSEIDKIFRSKYDTVYIVDPINGDEIMKIYGNEFRYTSVIKYRLKITTNPVVGGSAPTYSIQTISPVLDEYYESGDYIGEKPLLKMRYEDVRHIINRYEKRYPENKLETAIPR